MNYQTLIGSIIEYMHISSAELSKWLGKIYVRSGKLDAVVLSSSNLVDDIVLAMHKNGIHSCLQDALPDKRKDNQPFHLT